MGAPSKVRKVDWRRWALALALGLVGLLLNAFPVEILSGVHLLFGHGAVILAGVLLGPAAGAIAGAVAGAITPFEWGHYFAWVLFVAEGLAVGLLARRRLPLASTLLFWLGAAPLYLLSLASVYPLGIASTVTLKSIGESALAALVLQVLLEAPRIHRALRPLLPPPLLSVTTKSAVRSIVMLAALLPLVVLSTAEARLLYRQRLVELDRDNLAVADATAAAIAERIARASASVERTARELDRDASDVEGRLEALLLESWIVREAVVADREGRPVAQVARPPGPSLAAPIPREPGFRWLGTSTLVIATNTRAGTLVVALDATQLGNMLAARTPRNGQLLLIRADGRLLAAAGDGEIGEPMLEAALRAARGTGISTFLTDPRSLRSLRPQATMRVASEEVGSYGVYVVVARSQVAIQPALEQEALGLLAGFCVALAVALLAGFALVRIVVDPVQAVSLVASRLEGGERSARVDGRAEDAPLEIRQLGEGFNRMADELARQLEVAENANRAKDEFLSIASHELKTPLTTLKAQVQLLERKAGPDQAERLRVVDRQLDRLSRLVSQLLEASALGAGVLALEARDMELSEVVRRVAEGLVSAAPRHSLRLDLEPCIGCWDELRLEQVLHNLIGNAIKYSPAGGPIEVTLRPTVEGGAELRIADRGVGVSAGAPIFERFGRGETPAAAGIRGMGVGLYVVREIVQRHGGSIELLPREGGGTVAVLRLPPAAPELAAPSTGMQA